MNKEEKSAKFKVVAERRVTELLHKLDVLGNLSSRGNYEYSEDDVKKIFKAIENKTEQVKKYFSRRKLGNFKL